MIQKPVPPRILIVAGSDSGGGAGIQADIKTVMALGGYAGTAITALTAQNTLGVRGIHPIPPEFVALQMTTFIEDIGIDAVKTGMLHSAATIEAVANVLEHHAMTCPLVLDPVMVAKGGAALLEEDAVSVLMERLLPLAAIITPNIPEAALLTGISIDGLPAMKQAAAALLEKGAKAVLLKGGHLEGPVIYDVLAARNELEIFESRRVDTPHTHGTGCTLASAVATMLPKKIRLRDAVESARRYVRRAIVTAPGIGHGHGPLNHDAIIEETFDRAV